MFITYLTSIVTNMGSIVARLVLAATPQTSQSWRTPTVPSVSLDFLVKVKDFARVVLDGVPRKVGLIIRQMIVLAHI